jgi:hypothetical protein
LEIVTTSLQLVFNDLRKKDFIEPAGKIGHELKILVKKWRYRRI